MTVTQLLFLRPSQGGSAWPGREKGVPPLSALIEGARWEGGVGGSEGTDRAKPTGSLVLPAEQREEAGVWEQCPAQALPVLYLLPWGRALASPATPLPPALEPQIYVRTGNPDKKQICFILSLSAPHG